MFPGQYSDGETGLSQNGYRDYDPTMGRYIESDPIGLLGGANTYAYADNSPANYADPSGRCPYCVVAGVGAATAAAADAFFQYKKNGCINWLQVAGAAANGAFLGFGTAIMVDAAALAAADALGALGGALAGAEGLGAAEGGLAGGEGLGAAGLTGGAEGLGAADAGVTGGEGLGATGGLTGGEELGAAEGGVADAAGSATPPNRIYSARVLIRSAEDPGPFHNFPESFNQQIFDQGTRTVTPNYYSVARPGLSSDAVMYRFPGSVNRFMNGVFEIGVRPSVSGNTEVIMHRFFNTNP
jgi:RHS repeat-associated protein